MPASYSQIVRELRQWEEARCAEIDRRVAFDTEHKERLLGLLTRARDAGLENSEIAAALNGQDVYPKHANSGWWTTRAVAHDMALAQGDASMVERDPDIYLRVT